KAEKALEKADITLNKNMVPFDTESPFVTSGIRIGTPAMTTRGFKEETFKTVAKLIDKIIQDPDNEEVISEVKKQVGEICEQYPLYDFVTAYQQLIFYRFTVLLVLARVCFCGLVMRFITFNLFIINGILKFADAFSHSSCQLWNFAGSE